MYICVMVLEIDNTTLKLLRQIQRNTSDRTEYVKVSCVIFIHEKILPERVAFLLGVDLSTVYRYVSLYKGKGLDFLQTNHEGYSGKLDDDQILQLTSELQSKLYLTSDEIIDWVVVQFSILFTKNGMVKLLHRIGFSYKKTKQVPFEADIQRQQDFVEQELKAIIEGARQGKSKVYFMDAVHPTHNTRSTYGWIQRGKEKELLTVSGRDRVNINGALNALDPTDIQVLECESVNAQTTKDLYLKILESNQGIDKIYTIADNARYYKNKELKEWLKDTKIEQVFLPPYSPNLNIIERLWKFLKKKVINSTFFRTKHEFREAVHTFFENVGQYKNELASLLTLNFPILNSQSILL